MAFFLPHIRQIWDRVILFLAYYRKAGTIYDLHSPFLFRFIEFVMDPARLYYDMARLRPIRDLTMRKDAERPPQVTSKGYHSRFSCCRRWTAQCLYRIVLFQKARRILILGTGNGLDALFLNRAAGAGAEIFAIEPDPEHRTQSREILTLYAPGIHLFSGLNELMGSLPKSETVSWDLVFWGRSYSSDAGSQDILQQITDMTSKSGTWVLAEPHDNLARYEFWRALTNRQRSLASFRCWSFGIIFFSPSFHEKHHFTYIPWKLKPWGIGLWGKGLPLAAEK